MCTYFASVLQLSTLSDRQSAPGHTASSATSAISSEISTISSAMEDENVAETCSLTGIVKESPGSVLTCECSVCGGPAAAHLHYGAISCYSCR